MIDKLLPRGSTVTAQLVTAAVLAYDLLINIRTGEMRAWPDVPPEEVEDKLVQAIQRYSNATVTPMGSREKQ